MTAVDGWLSLPLRKTGDPQEPEIKTSAVATKEPNYACGGHVNTYSGLARVRK